MLDFDALSQEPVACVGCGFCCRKARCILGALLHGPGRECPSLVFWDGKWRCKPVLDATGDHRTFLAQQLYLGEGCCSSMNSDRARFRKDQDGGPDGPRPVQAE